MYRSGLKVIFQEVIGLKRLGLDYSGIGILKFAHKSSPIFLVFMFYLIKQTDILKM